MKKAIVDLKQIKDKLKMLVEVFPEEKELQITVGKKSFLGMKSFLLVQSFFTAEVDEPFELKVNIDEFKKTCSLFRSKSQMATICLSDELLIVENAKRKETISLISTVEYKEKDLKYFTLGKLNPVDLKCLLKVSRPSTALTINKGLNEDLFVINKEGDLTMGVYSYSNSITQFLQFEEKNSYKDIQAFVPYEYLSTVLKIFKEQFMPIQLGIFNKFLILETESLCVYLPINKMGVELTMNNAQQNNNGKFVRVADVKKKNTASESTCALNTNVLIDSELELTELLDLLNEKASRKESITRRFKGLLPGSENVLLCQDINGLYSFCFKREFGLLYLYC